MSIDKLIKEEINRAVAPLIAELEELRAQISQKRKTGTFEELAEYLDMKESSLAEKVSAMTERERWKVGRRYRYDFAACEEWFRAQSRYSGNRAGD